MTQARVIRLEINLRCHSSGATHLVFETGFLTGKGSACRLGWPGEDSPVPVSRVLGWPVCHHVWLFRWGLNSGLQAYTASPLPTKPSPQPHPGPLSWSLSLLPVYYELKKTSTPAPAIKHVLSSPGDTAPETEPSRTVSPNENALRMCFARYLLTVTRKSN